MKLFILAIIIVGIAIAGLAIKMFFIKDGKFTKKCSSSGIEGMEHSACSCNSESEEEHSKCKYYKTHHPKEADTI